MRKILFLLAMCFPLCVFSQTGDEVDEKESVDSVDVVPVITADSKEIPVTQTKKKKSSKSKKTVLDDISVKMDILNFCQQYIASNLNAARYKLYQTDNMNYLLKLDTFTGRVWLVQWSLEIAEEGVDVINDTPLANVNYVRFELYPTKNIYQFILLDRETGTQWHIQWGVEPDNRWIRIIE